MIRWHAKRWLFLLHRWLGVAMCALFAMWFVSGVVMMYVGYPKLTNMERLQHLPVLSASASKAWLGPQQALETAGIYGFLQDLRLAMASGGRAVYLATPARTAKSTIDGRSPGNDTIVIDATSGTVLDHVDAAHALASAAAFSGPGVEMLYEGVIDEDAFSHSRSLDSHRPLHRVQLQDAAATLLYVSGKTGEVVRDAPQTERLWSYVGAWIHWLYLLRGNVFNPYWSDAVNGLSLVGVMLVGTGLLVGFLRLRWVGTFRSGSRSPYQGRMMHWHHMVGLVFGLMTATWIFSGLMSMNPWRIFSNTAPPLRQESMHDGLLQMNTALAHPSAFIAATPYPARELRWAQTLGQTQVLITGVAGSTLVLDGVSTNPRDLDPEVLRNAVARLVPAPVVQIEVLNAFDMYYYARQPHTMTGGSDKPLPVWRVVFADPYRTWVHIDPHTGAIVERSDRERRMSRWLFSMLHSWDWLPLLERRPLWDGVLIVLSLGGTVLSLTGIAIGWRRLGRKLRTKPRQRPRACSH